jgi:hypothetical protein
MKKIKRSEIKIYAIDLDNTLTKHTCWTPEDCLSVEPDMKMVGKIHELMKSHFCFIYTCRQDWLLPSTMEWLRKHSLPQIISNQKVNCDFYVDDKMIHPEEL